MDFAQFLTDILVVLVAAKVAAELSERIGIPAVVGEIVAGMLIGPSVLGLVGEDEVLVTLGEIGVILLLLEVGMEMDLRELRKVGRSSFLVAVVGVVMPLALGYLAMGAITDDGNTKLFVAAALTATSVGITARVFGDLRALATTEARLVLGAAVADDVMGLVVLTVVVRLVTEGSVSVLSILGIVGLAVAFLVGGGLAGLKVADPLFRAVERVSRSTGTLVALGFAFALAFARLAEAARLAPIVGAFVAGIALSRAEAAPRIRRELAPVGHLFIPVFFLQIGIAADVTAFFSLDVLRDAALLLVVATVGKLVAAVGAIGSPGDKALIGLGMLPRGEVGLIFATIGLTNGVLGDDLYAALLLVVLATTLATPPLLKWRYGRLDRSAAVPTTPDAGRRPGPTWLTVVDGELTLEAVPPAADGVRVALAAAERVTDHPPAQALLDWLRSLPDADLVVDDEVRSRLVALVVGGDEAGWRLLLQVGLLERLLPELVAALRADDGDQVFLDTDAEARLAALALRGDGPAPRVAAELAELVHPDAVHLARMVLSAGGSDAARTTLAEAVGARLDLDPARKATVVTLAGHGTELLWSESSHPEVVSEAAVEGLARRLGDLDTARGLFVVTALAHPDAADWHQEHLAERYDRIRARLGALVGDDGPSS